MPHRPETPNFPAWVKKIEDRLFNVERQVIYPPLTEEMLEAFEDGMPLGPVEQLDFGPGILATLVGDKRVRVEGSVTGGTEFDAIVDGGAAASSESERVFLGIGEACAYLDSLGLESVNILVRENDPSNTGSGNTAYVETANWNSPASVHIFGLRGGYGQQQIHTGAYWDIGTFRPVSSRFTPPNYYVHNLAEFDISGCATQKFGTLSIYNTGFCQWAGNWSAQLSSNLFVTNSYIRSIQAKTFATLCEMNFSDLIVGGLSGSSDAHRPGSAFFGFWGGNLMNESTSGTQSLTLPQVYDILMYESGNQSRAGTFAGQALQVTAPSGAAGRLHVMGAAFVPGSINFVQTATGEKVDLRGAFNDITINATKRYLLDVFCANLTLAATPSGESAGLAKAITTGNVDIREVIFNIAMSGTGEKTATFRGTCNGKIHGKSLAFTSATWLNFVGSISSHVEASYDETAASGTAKPFAMDGSSRDNMLTMNGAQDWPVAGTGAGGTNDNYFFPGDFSGAAGLPAAPTGELGGTWAATTVDEVHSGSSHQQAWERSWMGV